MHPTTLLPHVVDANTTLPAKVLTSPPPFYKDPWKLLLIALVLLDIVFAYWVFV